MAWLHSYILLGSHWTWLGCIVEGKYFKKWRINVCRAVEISFVYLTLLEL